MRLPLLLLVTLLPLAATAAEPATKDQPAVPAPPTVRDNGAPAAIEPPEGAIEPEVTITTRGETTYEEYRANGRLYMVKVIPKRGRPYYLVYDEFGRARRTDHQPSTVVPQWVIKSW
jgi:hypothetical protein